MTKFELYSKLTQEATEGPWENGIKGITILNYCFNIEAVRDKKPPRIEDLTFISISRTAMKELLELAKAASEFCEHNGENSAHEKRCDCRLCELEKSISTLQAEVNP